MNHEDDLYHLAKEIDAKVARAKDASRAAARARRTWQLPGEIGTFTTTGAGELVDVSLNASVVKSYSAASLSRKLLAGIQRAERDGGIA
ncbi:hypothetical protein [Amycolatopsis alba]|uniref:YbaB/EbfC family DNA-binding protein n=1 Tax=Amycolatopsis alba DSM 44262 TaxID=1125972 RepID=A0A229RPV4_AMYAL|nr:hypothetical protein [Amycolatopsis alba]OXM48702.1 hypothetical protein CFP75_20920 [Amycolatopsis alba DSM 44262]